VARELWEEDRTLLFASSANPSGQGNRGVVEGIGERISRGVDLVIESDEYVRSIQPDADEDTRHEQGVMVSFVDAEGRLVPEQHGQRGVSPAPALIRTGLSADRIMHHLSERFTTESRRLSGDPSRRRGSGAREVVRRSVPAGSRGRCNT
jgi:hypothetical protein